MENHSTLFFGSSITPFAFTLSPNLENSHQMHILSNKNEPNKEIRFRIVRVKEVSQKNKFIQIDQNKMKKSGKKTVENRKPRFAFQTRSPVDILDDGYRWRKYEAIIDVRMRNAMLRSKYNDNPKTKALL
ncbi:unnamed protein product [Fraxinus pennsylvanica]|uniref:Uncharacterized protein n=1 Tax=Fraxinus pennsylvanica TaxID=56036 RepID=A0AAD1Z4M1_9LAMI|nr:unnamed protein product [Fraxinus pennsylvanica]